MYCRKCGEKIKDTAQFCDKCGAEVILVKQKSYTQRYNELKKENKEKGQTMSKKDQEKYEKFKAEAKNPYIGAALFAAITALVLAAFPWSMIEKGLGLSWPIRIAVVVFALLGDYHSAKAKQTNRYLKGRYGFELRPQATSLAYGLSVFVTIIGLLALFIYE